MVVHFPVALLPADISLYAAGKFLNTPAVTEAGYYCLIAGVTVGWLVVLTGLMDLFLNIIKHGQKAMQRAYVHGTVQTVVVTGFTVLASTEYKNPELINVQPVWMLITKASLVIVLFAGNYLGGELLLKYVSRDFHG